MKKKSKSGAEPGYTEARQELDKILQELEEGRVDVDELTAKVERASTLIRLCRARLVEQETRVRQVAEELLADEEAAEEEEEEEAEENGEARKGEIPF